MTDITSDQLIKSIKDILKDGDLDYLSAKKIRKMLETEYKADFTERKEEIDKLVMKLITENEEKHSEEKKEQESKSSKVKNGKSQPAKRTAPAPLAKNKVAIEKEGDTDTNSKDDEKDNGSEDDNDSDIGEIEDRDIVPKKKAKVLSAAEKKLNDEELAKKLQEDEDVRPSRRCKAQSAVKKPRKQPKERVKGTSVYSRPCVLLPPLNKVLETDRMPRPTIVKRLWEIVKERNLLDPKNKQFMLCDDEMLNLFGKKKVRMFGMMKHLKPYIKDLPKV